MIIDTHCHLYNEDYENLDELIKKMQNKNIHAINNGIDLKSNREVLELSRKYNNIYGAIGFHPTEISDISKDYMNYIRENINNIVAIGEIGLDYYWDKSTKNFQIELFKNQLKIAEEYNKPVIIHSRDAIEDTYNILKNYKLKGIIHAFSGSYEMALKFIKLGFKIGIGGVITFKNTNLRDVVSKLDLKEIVLETDSPYLTPEPNRGKKNSPLNLEYIILAISSLKNMNYEEISNITTNTAIQLFDLNI